MFKIIKYIALAIIIIFIAGSFIYNRAINSSADGQGGDIYFLVTEGEGARQIAQNLAEANLIKSKFYFEVYVWRTGQEAKFQAGEYVLSPILSIKEIVEVIISGDTLDKEKTIKIIEGWNIKDITKYLKEKKIIFGEEFRKLSEAKAGSWALEIKKPDFLSEAPVNASLEGYLFPDTYRVFNDAGAEDIIGKMLTNFNSKLTKEMRSDISQQKKTIHEIVTMASIIEKEVAREKDRKIVAGILYKRLKTGMRLQVDSTINYITGKNNPQSELKDLEIDSPYNTYKYAGLPPGPIANPGLAAIKAAIYPEESPYLFYLNKQDDKGETVFSKTYQEHLKNKAKYLTK